MANRIKGITVEIGGDTTKLSKALEGVNRDIKGTQTQLKDVQKLLKLDPTNTELLSQKHKLLADAVSATKEKLEVLKTAAEQANTALANGEISQQQYDALQREIIETENELKRLTTEANNSHTALEKMGGRNAAVRRGQNFRCGTKAAAGHRWCHSSGNHCRENWCGFRFCHVKGGSCFGGDRFRDGCSPGKST